MKFGHSKYPNLGLIVSWKNILIKYDKDLLLTAVLNQWEWQYIYRNVLLCLAIRSLDNVNVCLVQSDREKEQGLPVAPFMDREKVTKPTAQIGFIKFVLLPMFETVSKLFPQLESVMVTPLREARDRYEGMKELEEKKKWR